MKSTKYAIAAVSLVILVCGPLGRADDAGLAKGAIALRGPELEASAKSTPAFGPSGVPYQGYGSVTVLSDGVAIVRLDGDPPRADDDDADWLEPIDSYWLAIDPEGCSLVNADGEWFLDRDGAELQQRGLDEADVLAIPLGGGGDSEEGGCERYGVLEIKGDLFFDWDANAGRGYLEIAAGDGATLFGLSFGVGGGGFFHSRGWCEIDCPDGSHCEIWCSFFGFIRVAHCYCDPNTGYAICECVGGGGGEFVILGAAAAAVVEEEASVEGG